MRLATGRKVKSLFLVTLIAFFIFAPTGSALTSSSTNFTVEDSALDELSGFGTSTNFGLHGSIPYISPTPGSSTNFGINPGFLSFGDTSSSTDDDDDEEEEEEDDEEDGGGGGGGGSGGSTPRPVAPPYIPPTGTIIDVIRPLLPIFFPPSPQPLDTTLPIEQIVPLVPPLALRNIWNLLPPEPIRELVFRPLPLEIRQLAGSFPQLHKLFSEVGITRFNDLQKLNNISLSIPGLTDVIALSGGVPLGGLPGQIRDLQLSDLTPDLKAKIPSSVLFAKIAGGKVDAKPTLRLTDSGASEQFVRVISGNELTLAVKPDAPATTITGYLVFKSRAVRAGVDRPFINDVLGIETAQAAGEEVAFLLEQFAYLDSDKDGIYTATIKAPPVSGEYEVVTVIDYVDPALGNRVLRLITVIDPEGYIYELAGGKEARIPGAVVSLEWLSPMTNDYQLWPASEYQQSNPQVTTVTGEYSFLVPAGSYRLVVNASGYTKYQSEPFAVTTGGGVHQNIELKNRFWLFAVLDWKTIALVLISTLLLFNFYRDKIRERKEREKLSHL